MYACALTLACTVHRTFIGYLRWGQSRAASVDADSQSLAAPHHESQPSLTPCCRALFPLPACRFPLHASHFPFPSPLFPHPSFPSPLPPPGVLPPRSEREVVPRFVLLRDRASGPHFRRRGWHVPDVPRGREKNEGRNPQPSTSTSTSTLTHSPLTLAQGEARACAQAGWGGHGGGACQEDEVRVEEKVVADARKATNLRVQRKHAETPVERVQQVSKVHHDCHPTPLKPSPLPPTHFSLCRCVHEQAFLARAQRLTRLGPGLGPEVGVGRLPRRPSRRSSRGNEPQVGGG